MGRGRKAKDSKDDGECWSLEEKSKFLTIVSKRPILWHTDYTHKKRKKLDEYDMVAEAMNKSG